MPLYLYHCEDCSQEFEFQIGSSEKTPDCPECHLDCLVKIPTAFAFNGQSKKSKSNSSPRAPQPEQKLKKEHQAGSHQHSHNHCHNHTHDHNNNRGGCGAKKVDQLLNKYKARL